jgi:hypothetical protein
MLLKKLDKDSGQRKHFQHQHQHGEGNMASNLEVEGNGS